jgi:hypothetical protein
MEKNHSLAKIKLKALINSPKTWPNQNFMNAELGNVIFLLRSVWINPFSSPARNAMCLLKEALKNIKEHNFSLAMADVAAALAYIES